MPAPARKRDGEDAAAATEVADRARRSSAPAARSTGREEVHRLMACAPPERRGETEAAGTRNRTAARARDGGDEEREVAPETAMNEDELVRRCRDPNRDPQVRRLGLPEPVADAWPAAMRAGGRHQAGRREPASGNSGPRGSGNRAGRSKVSAAGAAGRPGGRGRRLRRQGRGTCGPKEAICAAPTRHDVPARGADEALQGEGRNTGTGTGERRNRDG